MHGFLLELPFRGNSNENPQHMILSRKVLMVSKAKNDLLCWFTQHGNVHIMAITMRIFDFFCVRSLLYRKDSTIILLSRGAHWPSG